MLDVGCGSGDLAIALARDGHAVLGVDFVDAAIFLHLFAPDDRDRFADDLAAALRPGGRYYLLAFAVTFPAPNVPLAVTEDEVRARFVSERGWAVRACRAAEFRSRVATVPATCACVERVAGSGA